MRWGFLTPRIQPVRPAHHWGGPSLPHPGICMQRELPSTYSELTARSIASTRAALAASVSLIEVQFPAAVPDLATAALNQILDANRAFVREFLRGFPQLALAVLFPDAAEARLARQAWGPTPFAVGALPSGKEGAVVTDRLSEMVCVVVNPGFNVSEWLYCERLQGAKAVIMINGELDRVRGGYYPRLFYPRLWKCKERFLKSFEEVFYVKMLSNGGTLTREFPESWKLFYTDIRGDIRLLDEFETRPAFPEVENLLRIARTEELRKR